MQVRYASEADVTALAQLVVESVRMLGPMLYSDEQVEAWVAMADDTENFRAKIVDASCLIAEEDNQPLGFATLAPDGEVGMLYVRWDRSRQGIASTLLQEIVALAETRGLARLHTIASKFSRRLFSRFAFSVAETEQSEHHGAVFVRYRMTRDI